MKLHWVFSTFAIGGPQRRFCQLASKLGDDFTHMITAMDGVFDAEKLLDKKIKWTRLEIDVVKSGFFSVSNIRSFRRCLLEEKPDLLLTSNWGCIEWFFANPGLPHLHFEDGFGPDEAGGALNRKRSLTRRALFAFSPKAQFIAPSRSLESIFVRQWGVAKKRVHYFPNGVDTEKYHYKERLPNTKEIVIGTVAALRQEKRIDRLLRICANVSQSEDIRLLIVGGGELLDDLVALTKSLGIEDRVEFTGETADIRDHLDRMDLYALTSDTEQMPISLLEAMATGLPVVATDVGDIATMLPDENSAFTYSPDDEESFRKGVIRLIEDPSLRRTLGAANARRVEESFSERSMVDRYRSLISEMVRL